MSGRDSLWETHVVTGSQRELAEYILEQWRMEGDVIHEDGFYFYDPDSGTWFEREIEACRRDVLALNGRIYGPKMLTSAGDVKQSRVKMTDRLCNSVLRVVATLANRRERTSDPGFFDEAPPGVLAGGTQYTHARRARSGRSMDMHIFHASPDDRGKVPDIAWATLLL